MALSYSDLEGIWIQAGGNPAAAAVAAAVALAESSGNPNATNPYDNYGAQTSWGLWQISNGTHNKPDPNVLDPLTNAKLAVAKYNAAGGTFGRDWGTYVSGAYLKFMQGNVPPNMTAGGATGGAGGGDATQASFGGDVANSIISSFYPVVNMTGNLVTFAFLIIFGGTIVVAGLYMLFKTSSAVGALSTVGGPVGGIAAKAAVKSVSLGAKS